MEQPEEESVLLIIKEETKFATAKRITRIHTILDQIGMRGYNPMDDESPIEMISSGEYKFDFLLISLELEELNKIVQVCKTHFPNIGIMVLYDKNTTELESKLSDLEKKFGIKSSLERSAISMNNLTHAFKQIKTDNILKKGSDQRYSFIQNINSGTQGIVDLYLDMQEKKLIAIKRIQTDGMSKDQRTKVVLEVNLMKSIRTPLIIEFFDSTFDNDFRYIYMEYADAGTLEQRINDHKIKGQNFTYDSILNWIIEILLALFTMNRHKMMHRDIKSENILLKTVNGQMVAKLSDLGISRQVLEGVNKMTLCGTPYYVCPEIASEMESYGFNIDIWSLGVVLYELVTLRKPFGDASDADKTTLEQNLSPSELYEVIKTKPFPKLPRDTDPRLKFLIKNMLIKNPNRRFDAEDCLKVDFVHERMMEIAHKFGWDKEIPDFEYLANLGRTRTTCYKTLDIIQEVEIKLIHNALRLFDQCSYTPYYKFYYVGQVKNTITAKTLIDMCVLLNEGNEEENNQEISEEEVRSFFSELLEKEILIPYSHPAPNLEKALDIFFNNSQNAYYIFSFDNFDKIDNFPIIQESRLTFTKYPHYDLVALSQFLLKQCKYMYKRMTAEENEENVIFTNEYVKFLAGLSALKHFSIRDLKEEDRLICVLNLYQTMFIHYLLIFRRDDHNKKDQIINYSFKDMTLNNLEIKHIVFRNKKKLPNSLLFGVEEFKTQILPNFSDHRPLFILYEFDLEALENKSKYRFKVFKRKALEIQLNRVVLKFVYKFVRKEEDMILIPNYMQNYVKDFDQNDTQEFPQHMLEFINEMILLNSDPKVAQIFRLPIDQSSSNLIDPIFGNMNTFLKNLQVKNWRVAYY